MSSMPKAQQHLVPIKGQTDCMETLCPQMRCAEQMLFFWFWIEFQSDFEKKQTSFVTLPIPLS